MVIENYKQYQVTQYQIQKLRASLSNLSTEIEEQPLLRLAERQGIESLLEELEKQVQEYNTQKKMKVINLYGGAGIGKSTLAALLFYELKVARVNVELVTEYQKDLTYEEASKVTWDNQVWLFANQQHKLHRLKGKVDVAITDNPLLTALAYRQFTNTPSSLDTLVLDCYKEFENYNFVLVRNPDYFNSAGRIHTLEQSQEVDVLITNVLRKNAIPFYLVEGYTGIKDILQQFISF